MTSIPSIMCRISSASSLCMAPINQNNRTICGVQQPCGLLRRLLVMLYDAVIVLGLLVLAAGVALPITGGHYVALRDPLYTAYLVSVWFIYLGWCWVHGGMTLGMRAWKVRLAGMDEKPIGWRRALARFLASWLSAAALGLGFWWSAFDRRGLAWHDRLSATLIVRAR